MSMYFVVKIARKEFLEIVRDGRFRTMGAIVVTLLIGALIVGWKNYLDVRKQRDAAQSVAREEWQSQPAHNPHTAAHYGVYAVKPAPPLSLADPGIDPYAGTAVYLEAHYQDPARYRPIEDAPAVARMGELTAAAVLQFLVPLLLVVLVHSSIAGERERGTLTYVRSLGLPYRWLVTGKAAGNALALSILIVPAAVTGSVALSFTGASPIEGLWSRVLWLAAGYLIYHLGWVAVSLGVSGRAFSSGSALRILLVLWTVTSFIVPVIFVDVAERVYPSISGAQFAESVEKDIREGLDGHNPSSQRYEAGVASILQKYGVAKVEDLPVNIEGLMYLESERYSDRVMDKHYGELWRLHDRQRRIHWWGSLFAPLTAIRSWSAALAGTDDFHHREFTIAAEHYRRDLVRRLNEDLAYNSRYEDTRTRSKVGGHDHYADAALWASIPTFQYTPPTLARVLSREFPSLIVLLVWLGMTTGILFLLSGASNNAA
jgi:ABC-2 type transport system permease protein